MIAASMHRRTRCWRRGIVLAFLTTATLAGKPTASPVDESSDHAPQGVVHSADDERLRRQRVAAKFHSRVLDRMDQAIRDAIAEGRLPGGVLWIEREGAAFLAVHGERSLVPTREKMTRDTIFDVASLTKVVATAPAVMKLVERGEIQLTDPVPKYIPEFSGQGKEKITIQQLLTHTSGLRPGIAVRPAWSGSDRAIRMAGAETVQWSPGSAFGYSDIDFLLLAEVVRRVSGRSFEEFVRTEIFEPLNMRDTGFAPDSAEVERIAPTEPANGEMLRGTVHDPTARYMGGVAGHAGLFSTIDDLAKYSRMLINGGESDGTRVLASETVRRMTSVQTPEAVPERRGLGWDIDSAYSRPRGRYFPIGSFGHTGFTGTSLWIDPFSQTFWIFLSNRLHPDGGGNVLPLQAELADLAALAVREFDFTAVEGALPPGDSQQARPTAARADVWNGIDVLKADDFAALHGANVGLITNHTGRDRDGTPTIDLLHEAENLNLVALFSPEHGIRGELDAYVDDGVDERTGLPIYSLYGRRRSPLPEQLAGIDALVFDIQDIGSRFYTYVSTMGNAMKIAAAMGVKFVVLDRLNPITGSMVQGPVLEGKTDFVGWHAIPVRHGMTVGELARMFNEERNLGVDLQVIELGGWKRGMWLDQTTIPWIDTSPNMRSLAQATLYPGVGLLETTHLSVGRGTDTPFELFGAPYIDGERLAERMNAFGIRGVRFDPVEFTPEASKFANQECEGVRIAVVDRDGCDVVNIGIAGALALNALYPDEFGLARFGGLLKHPATLKAIREGRPLPEIRRLWRPELSAFEALRRKYLLYPPISTRFDAAR
jgi:uncharacterized protein YbbC (DUF1343 family)/CubicO group peptidase (beta-lactamase class C family)